MYLDEDFNALLDDLKSAYEHEVQRADRMQKKLDEWNKEEEIQRYKNKAEYERSHSLLTLSDKEKEAERSFRKKHYELCAKPLHSKLAGNTYIYELTGTGFGTIIKISCPICGESEDITDEESW